MNRFFWTYFLLAFERKVVEAIVECAHSVVGEPTYRFTVQAVKRRLEEGGDDADDVELDDVLTRLVEARMIRISHAVGDNLGYQLLRQNGDFRIAEMLDHAIGIEDRPTCTVHPMELKICELMVRNHLPPGWALTGSW